MPLDLCHIARALGGKVIGRNRVAAPGPGHSRRDRSLVIKLDDRAPDGFVVFSHAGDDWKECRDHVRQRLGLPDWQSGDEQWRRLPSSRIVQWDHTTIEIEGNEDPRVWDEDEVIRIAGARRIWDEGGDPRAKLSEVYLRRHRKLDLPEHLAMSTLRFHARCPWRNENTGNIDRVPALIAAFRSIDDDSVTGIQRIRLNADGSKHSRKMLGLVSRAAIKFDPAGAELCIGEGIETCLAGRQFGLSPVWALGSVGAISFFPIIEGVKRLIILGEAGEASARAIKICSQRWQQAERQVRAVMPDDGCNDLNDELMRAAQ